MMPGLNPNGNDPRSRRARPQIPPGIIPAEQPDRTGPGRSDPDQPRSHRAGPAPPHVQPGAPSLPPGPLPPPPGPARPRRESRPSAGPAATPPAEPAPPAAVPPPLPAAGPPYLRPQRGLRGRIRAAGPAPPRAAITSAGPGRSQRGPAPGEPPRAARPGPPHRPLPAGRALIGCSWVNPVSYWMFKISIKYRPRLFPPSQQGRGAHHGVAPLIGQCGRQSKTNRAFSSRLTTGAGLLLTLRVDWLNGRQPAFLFAGAVVNH